MIVPLSRNGIVTVLILAFVAIWNDYLTALVLLPDQANRTLSVALAYREGRVSRRLRHDVGRDRVRGRADAASLYLFLKERHRAPAWPPARSRDDTQ